ncbi:transposable element Tc1 transposase [Trichonephila clavipes]|nr:transposable element Tc1 transposase [Trichonephila clavipes]
MDCMRGFLYTYMITLKANHRWLGLLWALKYRAQRAYWQQVDFSDESSFNLWNYDDHIRVPFQSRSLAECIIERHRGRTPRCKVWGAISYHGRSQLLRIEGNLNSNMCIRELLEFEVVFFF